MVLILSKPYQVLRLFTLSCIFCVSLFANAKGHAKANGEKYLTLPEALTLSLKNNPDLAAKNADFAAKVGAAITAQTLTNPDSKVDTVVIKSGQAKVVGDLEQRLRMSDFGLRRAYSAALQAAATVELQADIVQVLNDTALLYYRLWALQEQKTILEEAKVEAHRVSGLVAQSFALGQTNVAAQNIFEAEAARFEAELAGINAERTDAQIRLQRATGIVTNRLALAKPIFSPLPSAPQLSAFASTRASLLNLVLARQRTAAKAYDVAKADAFPELSPRFLYGYDGEFSEYEFGAGIKVTLPIWDRKQGEILRTKGAKEAADAAVQNMDRVTLDQVIDSRRKRLLAYEEKLRLYNENVIPSYQKAYEGILEMWQLGQANAIQVFEVQRTYFNTRQQSLTFAVDALSARTLLEQVIGGKLEEVAR